METDLLSKTNQTGLIIITGIFLMFFMGTILLLFFHYSKKKIFQKELEKKELENEYQRDLILATLEVQETERKRIAQDLHDDISSKLNIVSLNSHMLTTPDLTHQEITEITGNIINMIGKTLNNSRRLAHDLLPPVLDKFGLDAGIEELCFEINSTKSIEVHYNNRVEFNEEDKNKHLHVFRIIQELTNNSIKHGNASLISLKFESVESKIVCTYSDNGKGFDSKAIGNKKTGLGMKNIESRIIFLGGSIKVNSAVNKGINVVFNF
ncbi:sensor histidine kinase [Flavobacterium sp. AG291]|uniref:sensor histidine kinase n=1 Tax=Flavobacterium sp. AG291 TaxID=2184000 RepID=UPI000E2B405D|nr:histidine kinase [Flavobacterium sp. AG291]RDI14617.1 histidine kinase/DNA gyrase B/HSP90-like ATPase [Flavobacterium sp. AG291]